MHFAPLAILGLVSQAAALAAPDYPGFTVAWKDTFDGAKGSAPNANWVLKNPKVNNEQQIYDTEQANTHTGQLSGGSTLQIIPQKDNQGHWHSARFEGKYLLKPTPGKVTRAEAMIRFGDGGNKQGLWPAFWMLGDSINHGTNWPACGEVDILETVNGKLTGYGTMHCDVIPGGACNEGMGLQSNIPMPNEGWHNWRVEWDLTSGDWQQQKLTWFMDGRQFHQVTGGKLNNANAWNAVAHSPLFFILNVAVGGNWVSTISLYSIIYRNILTLFHSPVCPLPTLHLVLTT